LRFSPAVAAPAMASTSVADSTPATIVFIAVSPLLDVR
jgi:hypothetical protein